MDVGPRPSVSVVHTDRFTPKFSCERTVPLTGQAFEVICRLHAKRDTRDPRAFVFRGATGGQLSGPYVSERFRKYRRMAGLPEELKFHSLRHTFASWWVQRGGDLYRLKKVMGHKHIETTMQYAHLRQESLREEMEMLFGDDGSGDPSEMERLRDRLDQLKAENEQLRERLNDDE